MCCYCGSVLVYTIDQENLANHYLHKDIECFMTPFQQILNITLKNVQKLLVDFRMPGNDNTLYDNSQFKHIYDPSGITAKDNANYDIDIYHGYDAYKDDGTRRPYKGSNPDSSDLFYPLTIQETLDLQDLRILDFIQLGFIPIEDMDKYEKPSLFIANATDRHRVDPASTTLRQVEEVIPLNFRLVTKQPDDYMLDQTNIIIVDKVLEGLKYVLNEDDYINLSFQRRGYKSPTVIRGINFVQALNLEELMDPYEVVDYLFQIIVREQRSLSKLVPTILLHVSGNNQSATEGEALTNPLIVQVNDQHGDPFQGSTVTFSVSPNDATLGTTTAITDSDGRAQTTLTLGGTIGDYTVTASVSGLKSVTFIATASV